MLGMFMRWLCTPKHTLAITLKYPIHYDFRQPFRPAGARYQLLLYLCLPFCFDNSSVLGVLKSTKLPRTTTEVKDPTMTGTTVAKGYV